MLFAVDVEGRGSVDAALQAAQVVLLDSPGVDTLGQLLVEPLGVQPEALRVGKESLVAQVSLVLVEKIVHLPELALGGRRFRSFRSLLGVRMGWRDREVAEDEPEPASHPGLQ